MGEYQRAQDNNQGAINLNLIINNNYQLNNISNPSEEDKHPEDTFIEKSNVDENPFDDDDSSYNPDDSKNQDKVCCISNLDIKNNSLVIEREVLHSDRSLITENDQKKDLLTNAKKMMSAIEEDNKTSEKVLKILAVVICLVLIGVISYICYFASKI